MYKFWRDYIWVCLLKKYDTPQWLQNVRRSDEHMSNKHVIRNI
jgi:hypothetical protein